MPLTFYEIFFARWKKKGLMGAAGKLVGLGLILAHRK